MTPTLLAIALMQMCENGFDNEHHHREWRKKWAKEIEGLPRVLNRAVLYAWSQAVHSGAEAPAEAPVPPVEADEPF